VDRAKIEKEPFASQMIDKEGFGLRRQETSYLSPLWTSSKREMCLGYTAAKHGRPMFCMLHLGLLDPQVGSARRLLTLTRAVREFRRASDPPRGKWAGREGKEWTSA
jgi:hypothetical protein